MNTWSWVDKFRITQTSATTSPLQDAGPLGPVCLEALELPRVSRWAGPINILI